MNFDTRNRNAHQIARWFVATFEGHLVREILSRLAQVRWKGSLKTRLERWEALHTLNLPLELVSSVGCLRELQPGSVVILSSHVPEGEAQFVSVDSQFECQVSVDGEAWSNTALAEVGQAVHYRLTAPPQRGVGFDFSLIMGAEAYPIVLFTRTGEGTDEPDPIDPLEMDPATSFGTHCSRPILVQGHAIPAPIHCEGGQYQINGGRWRCEPGLVFNGDVVRVRHAAPRHGEESTTTLCIGSQVKAFTTRTVQSFSPAPWLKAAAALGAITLGTQVACGGNTKSAPVNRPPSATNATFNNSGTPFNIAKSLNLLSLTQAADPEGDAITFRLNRTVSGADIGTLAVSGAAATFTPSAGIEGSAVFELVAVDAKGAASNPVNLTVSLVDTKAPVLVDPLYDTTSPTSHDVTVSVFTAEPEDIPAPSNWTRLGASGNWTYTRAYSANITGEPFTLTDRAGNASTKLITIANIDKVGPVVEDATYSTTAATNLDVTVTFRTAENLAAPSGWTKGIETGTGRYLFTKVYPSNATETVSFADAAGNKTDKVVNITWIDKTAPVVITFEAATVGSDTLDYHVVANEGGKGYLWFTATPPAQDPSAAEVVQQATTNATILTLVKDQVADFPRTGLTANTPYTLYLLTEDALGNRSAVRRLDTRTTMPADHPSVVAAPSFTAVAATSLTVVNAIEDLDGIRNITYLLYSDAAGTAQVGSNTTGNFSSLTANTPYWAKTTAETLNASTGAWALQVSSLATVTTTQALPAAPAATMTAASDSGASNSDRVTKLDPALTWTAVATATSYERSVDGGAYTDLGNVLTTTVSGLADGAHTIAIRAKNAAGSGSATTITVTIDKTAQAVPAPGNLGTVATATPTWTWSAVAGATAYLVSLDGGAETSVATASFTPGSALADGAHSITVKSVDLAGNTSAASTAATATVLINTPADLGVTFDATTDSGQFNNDNITNASIRFNFVIGANTTDIQRNIDGTGWTSVGTATSNTIAAGSLADGTHTIEYRAMKGVNPQAGAPTTFTITYDSALADQPFAVTPSVQGQTYADVQLTGEKLWKITSANGGTVGAVAYTAGVNHFSYTAPNTASDTLTLYDVAGNTRTKSVNLTAIPSTPNKPAAVNDTGKSNTDGITKDNQIAVPTVSGATKYEWIYRLNGGAVKTVETATSEYQFPDGDGTYTYSVKAGNAAGYSPSSPEATMLLDTVKPANPSWVGPAPSLQGTLYPNKQIAVVENGSGLDSTASATTLGVLNGGSISFVSASGNTVTANFTTPNDIGETVTLRVTDVAGNVSNILQLDTDILGSPLPAPPTGLALSNDTGASNTDRITSNATLAWNAVSGATGYEISANGTTWTDIGNVTTIDAKTALGLGDGSYTIQVRAKNAAGSGSAASLSFTLDTVAPANVNWSGVVPSRQGTQSLSLVLANVANDIATLVSLTDSTGGTIQNARIVSGQIVFDWTTPNAGTGTLVAVYRDLAGNERTRTINVTLTP